MNLVKLVNLMKLENQVGPAKLVKLVTLLSCSQLYRIETIVTLRIVKLIKGPAWPKIAHHTARAHIKANNNTQKKNKIIIILMANSPFVVDMLVESFQLVEPHWSQRSGSL